MHHLLDNPCAPIMSADRSSDPTSSIHPRCNSNSFKDTSTPLKTPLSIATLHIRPQLLATSRRSSSRRIMAAPSTPAQQTARRQIKYATFESVIELPFYHSLASHKINHDKLSEAPRRVLGQYVPGDEQRLLVQGDALSTDEYDPESSKTTQQLQEKEADSGAQQNSVPKVACRAEGLIKNFNTLEDFKNVKRSERLQQAAQTVRLHPYSTDKNSRS